VPHAWARNATDLALKSVLKAGLSADPCAFWQSFGNSRESFFEMTGTTLEDHYRRYDLVIHLESAAVRVPEGYARYPQAHRPEEIEQAARLDQLLGELWCRHPRYVKIEGTVDVEEKLSEGMSIIRRELGLAGHSG
jgi:hypothetical protein